ncbi:MAG: hypothetical protein RBT11_01755 [Desulfobacterales bacterium]|jgi:hypothetical protein|nr:hypothetical protein [Desulfobacterales bacterium]
MAKVRNTSICSNCDEVFASNEAGLCPVCGSAVVTPLSVWVMPLDWVCVSDTPRPGRSDEKRLRLVSSR